MNGLDPYGHESERNLFRGYGVDYRDFFRGQPRFSEVFGETPKGAGGTPALPKQDPCAGESEENLFMGFGLKPK